ncbi:histidinol-phosphatase [Rhizobium sp. RCAM05973]|uniref:histidinol-phosphatase n=1 Tax=Rhizobium sp. RCAM05973 TaxID=2994066 RepID=UPI0022EBE1D5|nr:histidinol-phosphatase [Rhizobium sp. RCAM05973]
MRLPDQTFLAKLADAADKETLSRFRKRQAVSSKPKEGYSFDPVTEADRASEFAMRELIAREYPEHAISGEEYGSAGEGPVRWVLDPIDGTRPYLCGIPVWGTLIGVTVDDVAIMGMMSQPVTGERFWADPNGSWLDVHGIRSRLASSSQTSLSDAILHTNSPEQVKRNSEVNFSGLSETVKLTRYGGECYAFAMLAAGQIDLCIEFNLQPYDIVALIPIIEQAGGVITTLAGKRPEAGGKILASANEELHEAALALLAG